MTSRFRGHFGLAWLLGCAALLAPSVAEAQEKSEFLVADPVDFDFTPLVHSEIAQASTEGQPSGTDNQAGAVPSGESVAAEEGSLAKAAQNPIASLISVPIQWNSTPNTQWAPNLLDPKAKQNRTQNVVNVQPVVPFKVSDGLTLVTRTVVPFISQPWVGDTSIQALGDINPSVFFVPTLKGNFTVGVGPTMVLPTATDSRLSSGQWSAGPTGVLVYTKGKIVAGGLINNIWSFAGNSKRNDVNKMLIQPFLNYNLPKGWYLTSSPIITANWNTPDNKGWTVPVGAGFGRVFVLGKQPVNASLSAYYNAIKPEVAGETLMGDWTLRAQVQFLFPTGS